MADLTIETARQYFSFRYEKMYPVFVEVFNHKAQLLLDLLLHPETEAEAAFYLREILKIFTTFTFKETTEQDNYDQIQKNFARADSGIAVYLATTCFTLINDLTIDFNLDSNQLIKLTSEFFSQNSLYFLKLLSQPL